jgi:hypothetical protein
MQIYTPSFGQETLGHPLLQACHDSYPPKTRPRRASSTNVLLPVFPRAPIVRREPSPLKTRFAPTFRQLGRATASQAPNANILDAMPNRYGTFVVVPRCRRNG